MPDKIPTKPKPPIRFVTMRSMTRPEVYVVDLEFDEREETLYRDSIAHTFPLDECSEADAEHMADCLNERG